MLAQNYFFASKHRLNIGAFIIFKNHDGKNNKFGFGGGEPFIEIQIKQDMSKSIKCY